MPDQPDLLGLRRGNQPAGQQQVERDGVGDLAGEPDGGAAHRVEAPPRLRDAEPRRLPGDPDVGALEDLGAPATAGPSTAAISGFVSRKPLSRPLITNGSKPDLKLSSGDLLVAAFRSMPAQK
ncbi:hypothetical protein JCM10369A_36850 [Nocardioides pyridinolyticus]